MCGPLRQPLTPPPPLWGGIHNLEHTTPPVWGVIEPPPPHTVGGGYPGDPGLYKIPHCGPSRWGGVVALPTFMTEIHANECVSDGVRFL